MSFPYATIDSLLYILPRPLKRMIARSGLPKAICQLPGLDWVVLAGLYEPDVCATIKRVVKPGWLCADVGAHIGRIALLLARLIGPAGRVTAFEALPDNARLLQERCWFWGYGDRIRVENVAVSDGLQDRLWLFPGRGRSSAEWNIVGHDVDGNITKPELEVSATSLDAYFQAGSHLDFVKIDVEGAEARVLTGMTRLLREARPVVLVEFHDEVGWAGRAELLAARFHLYDMNGTRLDPGCQRVYHVLALPQEYDG